MFYVYIYFYPNGIPCYVGKGKGRRIAFKNHNKLLAKIIHDAGGAIPAAIIRSDLTEAEAFETEIALIAAIGRANLGLGPLVNLTDGGDGASGHRHSAEFKERQRIRNTGRKMPPEAVAKTAAFHRGKHKSPEAKAKMSAAKKGKRLLTSSKRENGSCLQGQTCWPSRPSDAGQNECISSGETMQP